MRWVTDRTGRFRKRPHYLPDETDTACERVILEFLKLKYGKIEFPVKTDDLTILIEQKADLDSYSDFSGEEGEVEGVTEFIPGRRPTVRIANALQAAYMENRLRTTLTHEYGHVHFHQFMFDVESLPRSLFDDDHQAEIRKCKRDNIVNAAESDWMEWQAGYACGAILMPVSALIDSVRSFRAQNGLPFRNLALASDEGQRLIVTVANTFQTSRDAARVRLLKKRILTDAGTGRTEELF